MRRKLTLLIAAVGVVLVAAAYLLYGRGLIRFNYPSHARFPVRGIDVSHHQGAIDWPRVRAAGIDFAFIKATEGRDHRDRGFVRNWTGARQAGVARGAYHFFTFCTPGLAQAENFLAVLAGSFGELAPVVDVEFDGNCSAPPAVSAIQAELLLFLGETERASGRRPMLYFTTEADRKILDARFAGYPRWPRNILREPREPPWLFWQFADNGRVSGVPTLVDLNVFSGSRQAFEALYASRP